MDTYIYVAKDIINSKKIKGEIELDSAESVKKYLIDKSLTPVSVKKKTALNGDLSEIGIFKQPIKLKDINFFCKQLASMVQAGISIAKALDICAKQCVNKNLKKHLEHIEEEVTRGKTFSEAVAEEGIFPDILVSMIECGEASGNIDEVLNKTVDHFDNQLGIRNKVKKALTYPAIVLVAIVVVVFILMIKVVPSYMDLLSDTGADVPLPTQIVVAVSDFCVAQWPILIGGTAVIVFLCIYLKKIKSVRMLLDRLSIKLPLFGDLNKKNLSASFASTMSMLVSAGIPMLNALEITKKVMGNAVAEEEMTAAMDTLRQGSTLLEAINQSVIFPPILLSMVNVGEESGSLDEMLGKISEYFKEEVNLAVESLMQLIEPILTIFMAVIIGGIMMAIMLPTFSAASAVM